MQKPPMLLVIEDNSHIRQLVVDVLQEQGYTVVEARNGKEGLAALSTAKPSLILLDLEMPIMSGWTFMQQLHALSIFVPMIVMSAQHHWAQQSVEMGAVDYLDKPFDVSRLLEVVAKYLP